MEIETIKGPLGAALSRGGNSRTPEIQKLSESRWGWCQEYWGGKV